MTREQIARVRQSWATLAPVAPRLAQAFYHQLFELDPAVRCVFAHVDLTARGIKFAATLDLLVATLDDPDRMVAELAGLGRRHSGYGVSERHYDLVGEALLWALEHALAPSWNAELQEGWSAAYILIASILKRAGQRASGGFPAVTRPVAH